MRVNGLGKPAENRMKHSRIQNFHALWSPQIAIMLTPRQFYRVPGSLGHSSPILHRPCVWGQGSFKVSLVCYGVQDLDYLKSLAWQVPSYGTRTSHPTNLLYNLEGKCSSYCILSLCGQMNLSRLYDHWAGRLGDGVSRCSRIDVFGSLVGVLFQTWSCSRRVTIHDWPRIKKRKLNFRERGSGAWPSFRLDIHGGSRGAGVANVLFRGAVFTLEIRYLRHPTNL